MVVVSVVLTRGSSIFKLLVSIFSLIAEVKLFMSKFSKALAADSLLVLFSEI